MFSLLPANRVSRWLEDCDPSAQPQHYVSEKRPNTHVYNRTFFAHELCHGQAVLDQLWRRSDEPKRSHRPVDQNYLLEFIEVYRAAARLQITERIHKDWESIWTVLVHQTRPFAAAPDDQSQVQLDEIGASPEVRNYIAKHNLLATICDVVGSVKKHFNAIRKIAISTDKDPDEEGQWIVIDVITSATADAAVVAYKAVVNDWNAKPINNNDFVRLTFTIM